MSANFDINSNFINNFCSAAFQPEIDRSSFDVEDCKIRTKGIFDFFFKSTQAQQQETPENKFKKMWTLREKNWNDLSPEQRIICNKNLNWLAPNQFLEKTQKQNNLEADRWTYLDSHDISIPGFDQHNIARLKTQLIVNGKVGIDREGNLVKADMLDKLTKMEKATIVEIRCDPHKPNPLFAILPNNHWELKNGEPFTAQLDKKYQRDVLPDVENKFIFTFISIPHSFSIQYSKKKEPSINEKASPDPIASSSSTKSLPEEQTARVTTVPLKEANFTLSEQAEAQKALEKARENLKALLAEEVKMPRMDSQHVESAAARFQQKQPPHLVPNNRLEKLAPHERVDARTGMRSMLISRLADIVLECHPQDRLKMASILIQRNKLTNKELEKFMSYIKNEDANLYAEINKKGFIPNLKAADMHKFLEANGREVSNRLVKEELAKGSKANPSSISLTSSGFSTAS